MRPDISLSSDFIVGFPGETEADFEADAELIEEVGFDQSFSFIYSRGPGTPAATLPDEVPHEVKQERLERLQARSTRRRATISRGMVGTTQRVLVEKPVAQKTARQLAGAPRTCAGSTSTAPRRWSAASWTCASPRRCRIRCAAGLVA